ncbi:hypothetical protein [Flagellimonas sp. SN16]|uniref:hypothetical protein n=1 Tax=Flagellimonas sp. SN16 TaxID=3415142 RepID=UPI003C5B044A
MSKIIILFAATILPATSALHGQISKEEVQDFSQKHPVSSVKHVFIERGVFGHKNQSNGKVEFVKNTIDFDQKSTKIEALENSIRIVDGTGKETVVSNNRVMYIHYQPESDKFYSNICIKLAD